MTEKRANRGTLTAEQVRKVLLYHLPHREYYSIEQTDAWQAITNELNAKIDGTCEMDFIETHEYLDGEEDYLCECNNCGRKSWEPAHDLPRFCGGCGKAVKR